MNLNLNKKRVLITGASRGIGAATARSFLQEGASTYLVSRGSDLLYQTKSKLIQDFSEDNIMVDECDCSSESSLQELSDRVKDKFGGLDVLVANVGDGVSVDDALPDSIQWEKTWKNNFEASLYTTRAFLPMLKESKGCLIFVSSITAMEAFGAPVDYSTAKTAVAALAKNMARKLALEVRVNVVAPGNIIFPGSPWDEKMKLDPSKTTNIIKENVPMNRFGKPEEVANAIVFLCSDRAKFITGSTLVVDGGQTVGIF
jgi:3-oxoacyl-[acyl-carrier protein] reductase